MEELIVELIKKYGEKYERLIRNALGYLERQEPKWGLEEPIDKRGYIHGLIERVNGNDE